MNYEEISDFELNVSVAEALRVFWYASPDMSPTGGWEYAHYLHECNMDDGEVEQSLPDYCNNPSDAWPIILENKICVMHDVMAEQCDGGSWIAQPSYGYQSERVRNDNPLRAAMIVFLMMKDEQNV